MEKTEQPPSENQSTMDSTPPSHQSESRLRIRSSSRLSRIENFRDRVQDSPSPHLPLPHHLISSSPNNNNNKTQSYLSLRRTPNSAPLHELLILSPSPLGRTKTHQFERSEMVEEPIELVGSSRRRCKPMGLLGCGSPRNSRRSTRRRLELEIRDERDLGLVDENVKPRKRKQSSRSRKEKLSLVPSVPSSNISPRIQSDDQSDLNHLGQLIYDLIMWKDAAKSTLWFGFGSLYILSSCFTRGISCSVFSAVSQLGLLFLALSFFYNSFSQRKNDVQQLDFKLKEDDIVRLARAILPAANLVITKMRNIFSGEPSMTLKVAPILLFGAEHGHFITLWKLYVIGFFISFTVPKLYSCYSEQINRQVENLRVWVLEAWGACAHKKIVAASIVTLFWKLSSIKTRFFAAFISVVILRYYRQQAEIQVEEEREVEGEERKQQQQQQSLVVVA